MLRLWAIVIFGGILLLSAPAIAASESGAFAIKDAGLVPCKLYLQERKSTSKRYYQYVGWVMGYLSAHNRYADDTVDIAPWQTTDLLAAFIGNYCRSNGEDRLIKATNRLVAALYPARLRSSSKKIRVTSEGKSVFIYEAILRRAQQMLSERGHFSGAVDGRFGPATRKALQSFQTEQKLKTTGLPDQRTLLLLFR